MKEKLRGFLGFLGLVEDEYGEFGPTNTPRPFSEAPEELEPDWNVPAPSPARSAAPPATRPSPYRMNPQAAPARTTSISVLDSSGARVRPLASAARAIAPYSSERDVAVVSPTSYDDSRRITDLLRSNRAVVVTTLTVDQVLARRLVDFTAGTAYALNAKIEMLVRGVYLVSPQGTHVGPDVKERLRAGNYRDVD